MKRRVFSEIKPGQQFSFSSDPKGKKMNIRLKGEALSFRNTMLLNGEEPFNAISMEDGSPIPHVDDMATVFTKE